MATTPTALVRIRLYPITRRKISPSAPTLFTPAAPTERFCGLIILPITPPDELVPAVRIGLWPSCCAVCAFRGPNNLVDDLSLPGRKTANQTRKQAINGKNKAAL